MDNMFSPNKGLPPPPCPAKPRNESLGSTLPTYRSRPSPAGTTAGLGGLSFATARSVFEKFQDNKELRSGLSNLAKNPIVQGAALTAAKDERVQSAAVSTLRNAIFGEAKGSPAALSTVASRFTCQGEGASPAVQPPSSIKERNLASLTKQFESRPIMGRPFPAGPNLNMNSTDMGNGGMMGNSSSDTQTSSLYPSLTAVDPFEYPPQLPSSGNPTSAMYLSDDLMVSGLSMALPLAVGQHQQSPEPLTNEPHALAKYPYNAASYDELSIAVGDTVLLKREVDSQWLYGTNTRSGESGIVPLSFLHVKVPLVPTLATISSSLSMPISLATSPDSLSFDLGQLKVQGNELGGEEPHLPTAHALYDFNTGVAGDLTFSCGDSITVTGRVNEDWLRGRLTTGVKEGIFPANFLQLDQNLLAKLDSLPSVDKNEPAMQPSNDIVTAAYDFDAEADGDLCFRTGDVIEVVRGPEAGSEWIVGRLNGRIGMVPLTYIHKSSSTNF